MLFVVGYVWFVAATIAFILAILTPNWLTFAKLSSAGSVVTVERGIFYLCNVNKNDGTFKTTTCLSMLQQQSSTDPNQWIYDIATACQSIAISCAGLSIIVLWLSGIYFYVCQRTKRTLCFLFFIIFLVMIVFCTSFIVWILLISETLKLGVSIDRNMFSWPMWLSVGATGGYLIALLSMILSFCFKRMRNNKVLQNYYRPRSQF